MKAIKYLFLKLWFLLTYSYLVMLCGIAYAESKEKHNCKDLVDIIKYIKNDKEPEDDEPIKENKKVIGFAK